MPLLLTYQGGGEAGEADDDVVVAGGGVDAEAAGEEFIHGEIGWDGEGGFGEGDVFHAGEDEAADVLAHAVEGEEIPLAVDAGEVVGADVAALGSLGLRFPVAELDFAALVQGFADGLEEEQVGGGGLGVAEGDECGHVGCGGFWGFMRV